MLADDEARVPSVFIVPLTLIGVGLVMFMAFLNSQPALAVLCALVFLMAAGARIWSRYALSAVHHDLDLDKRRLFPGETLALSVRLENKKFLPVWLQLEIAHDGYLTAPSDQPSLQKDCGLLWYQAVGFDWRLRAARRGVHRVGPLRLKAGDLFGFYLQQKQIVRPIEIIVYPQIVALAPLLLPRRDFFGIPGARSPIEDPVYIHGTRDYHHRRPARFIHWKASARHNRLQEKVCEPAEQEKVLIMIRTDNFDADTTGRAFERCLEAAASLAVKYDHQRYAVGLATNGRLIGEGRRVLPVSRNRHQISGIMETLARLTVEPQGKLLDVIRGGAALPWGVTCIFFQYEAGLESLEVSRHLQHRGIPAVSVVCAADAAPLKQETAENHVLFRLQDILAAGERTP